MPPAAHNMRLTIASLALAMACLTAAGAAEAACSDPPAPKVDWRRCNFDRYPLSGIDISQANLDNASFNWAILEAARLDGINGGRVTFSRAKLAHASFKGAQLRDADFSQADLAEADLSGANLIDANFQSAVLRGANLSGARIRDADFFRADLSGATWIDGKHVCAEGSISFCR